VITAPIHHDEEDEYLWDPSGGHYTVRTGYKILQENQIKKSGILGK